MKPKGYWDDFENLKKEIFGVAKIFEDRMPTKGELQEINKGNIYTAIKKHGGIETVAKKLGLKKKFKRTYLKKTVSKLQEKFI